MTACSQCAVTLARRGGGGAAAAAPLPAALLYYMAAILAHHTTRARRAPSHQQAHKVCYPAGAAASLPLPSLHDFHLPLLLHLDFLSLEQRPRPTDRPRFHSPLHHTALFSDVSQSVSQSVSQLFFSSFFFPEKQSDVLHERNQIRRCFCPGSKQD